MSGIFGVFYRNNSPVVPYLIDTMRQAMTEWGPDGINVWLEGCAGLGQAGFFNTVEARYKRLPYVDTAGGYIFTAAARLDNRDELLGACGLLQADTLTISDSDLLRQAYLHWGEDCVKHIYGDWAFAAYHPVERRLFLARDHYGNTALYYYADTNVFAFASSRKALLALGLTPVEMDELYLAQVLVSWPAYHGEHTVHQPLKRLPPAHCLTVTPGRLEKRCYWRMEDTPELRLPCREDYVEGFKEVFGKAVKDRLRTTGDLKNGQIAITLSGGLDSGSVAATAARFLREEGRRLTAYTSVPLSNTKLYLGERSFGDELPFAKATARYIGNIDLFPVNAAITSPIQAIRRKLEIGNEPAHGAGNFFWMQNLMETARDKGCRILLTGQCGNAGISWTGDVFSQPVDFQLRHFGWRRWLKEIQKRYVPRSYLKLRMLKEKNWSSSAINPAFARRINLLGHMFEDPDSLLSLKRTMLEQRFYVIKPGRSLTGARWYENGSAYGLEVRDPTADVRVLAYTLSVPDHIFMDPKTGLDRWLIREAMKGFLPDEVRLNCNRGRQAADLVPRLRACATEVEAALEELEQGPAAEYVNVSYMRQVWRIVQTKDTPEAFNKAGTVLMRGIMAGLFVNGFNKK